MAAPQDSWTILEIVRWATDYFRTKGVSEPRASAEVLLAHALAVSRLDLYLRYDQPLSPQELASFKALVIRRRQGEPVAYLTGHKEFWSLDFEVTPAVLIPRPETETLVAAVLEAVRDVGGRGAEPEASPLSPKPLPPITHRGLGEKSEGSTRDLTRDSSGPPFTLGFELGVGSGAVVVSLARELPQMNWLAVDLSYEALLVARENARRLDVAPHIRFLQSDLLRALKPGPQFTLLVANLPYVPEGEWQQLPREIKDFEPPAALVGGKDGLDLIKALVREAHHYLQPDGWLALEVGAGQADRVGELLEATEAYGRVEAIPDYHGVHRVVRARRRSQD